MWLGREDLAPDEQNEQHENHVYLGTIGDFFVKTALIVPVE